MEFEIYTLKKEDFTQLGKERFIKRNELKLTQVELFSFFHFMCVAASAFELFCVALLATNAFELFCVALLATNERFLYHSNLSFCISNLIYM